LICMIKSKWLSVLTKKKKKNSTSSLVWATSLTKAKTLRIASNKTRVWILC
jgi:hypothetical protein